MEKLSSIERIIGKATVEEKSEALDEMDDIFKNQKFENQDDWQELEKTSEELSIIS